jgi:hypothetical protein
MAQFRVSLPKEELEQLKFIEQNTDHIFGEMTKEAAESVAARVRANAPIQELSQHTKISRTYKTPSDDGINTKVYISGTLKAGKFTRRAKTGGKQYTSYKGTPLDFIAKVFEYGTSYRYTNNDAYRGFMGKKPYFRKSFTPSMIEAIMKKVQERESKGLLTDE